MAKKTASRVVKTIAAAAKALGVNSRTLKEWFTDPECPRERGKYDVDAIRAWREATKKPAVGSESARAKWETRKAKYDARMKALEFRTRLGKLISVDLAAQLVKQHIAEVVTHLDQLPDYAVAGLRVDTKVKSRLRDRIQQKVEDLRATLESSLRSMAAAARREGKKEATE